MVITDGSRGSGRRRRWGGCVGWLARRLLGRPLRRRLGRAAGGRRRAWLSGRGGRRRRGGGRRRGRAGAWGVGGALTPVDQLHDPVHDEAEQDRNRDNPPDDPRGLAIPRGRLGLLVEGVERLGRLLVGRRNFRMGRIGCRGSTRRRTAVVAVLRLLVVEVFRWARWANACHGTDRTDT